MSGVAALLRLRDGGDGAGVPQRTARALLAAAAHRGDRTPRLILGRHVALGHTARPTTPEAEREVLPAPDAAGRFWLTWDGRLDNREELANALALDAAQARELTDADYVLAAWERWGEACLPRLLGDWAIVIWDARERRLVAARDPLGWRPLYYTQAAGLLAVASEPGQIFASGLVTRRPNDDYVRRYLADVVQEPGETGYADVQRIEGGQLLVADAAGVRVRRYWDAPSVPERRHRRIDDYVDEFEELFERATTARLRSRTPVGVLLSGGHDSSYVTAVAARSTQLTALTGFVPGSRWMDERPFARAVAEQSGVPLHEIDISDAWSLSSATLPDVAFDDPDHPPQAAGNVRWTACARDAGLGVLLLGVGGDEWMRAQARPATDALTRGHLRAALRIAGASGRPAVPALIREAYRALTPGAAQDVADSIVRRNSARYELVEPERGRESVDAAERAVVWRRAHRRSLHHAWYRRLGPQIEWLDRHAQQAHGVEFRAPFNDLRIVEFMASVPDWVKQYDGRSKAVLRRAAEAVLPAAIPARLDHGIYDELIWAGARERESQRVSEAVDAVAALPGVRSGAVHAEVERWLHLHHPWPQRSWRIISAGMFLRGFSRWDFLRPASDTTIAVVRSGTLEREGNVTYEPQQEAV